MGFRRFLIAALVPVITSTAALAVPSPPTVKTGTTGLNGAAEKIAIVAPVGLRPVAGEGDCVGFDGCDAHVRNGDLVLIWQEPTVGVSSFTVYHVDAAGSEPRLIGTASKTYYPIPKSASGYAGTCYAVGVLGVAKLSQPYCYAPGATATVETLPLNSASTQVDWNFATVGTCDASPTAAQEMQALNRFGQGFSTVFPSLTQISSATGSLGQSGVYVGYETLSAPLTDNAYEARDCHFVLGSTGSNLTATAGLRVFGVNTRGQGNWLYSAKLKFESPTAISGQLSRVATPLASKSGACGKLDLALARTGSTGLEFGSTFKVQSNVSASTAETVIDVTQQLYVFLLSQSHVNDGFGFIVSPSAEASLPSVPGTSGSICLMSFGAKLEVVRF